MWTHELIELLAKVASMFFDAGGREFGRAAAQMLDVRDCYRAATVYRFNVDDSAITSLINPKITLPPDDPSWMCRFPNDFAVFEYSVPTPDARAIKVAALLNNFSDEYEYGEHRLIAIVFDPQSNMWALIKPALFWRDGKYALQTPAYAKYDILRIFYEQTSDYKAMMQRESNILISIAHDVSHMLQILHSRNVGLIEVVPSEAVNKKRLSKKKPPLVKYYTLTIDKTAVKHKVVGSVSWGQADNGKALHSVRGCVKHYTEEHKLFGRIAGDIFVPAHVRGDRKNGEIIKDYNVIGG